MPAAARVGDLTTHGTPLGPGPGSPNVLIGGLPAWRATADTHVCPLATPAPVVPHVGGVAMNGSFKVFINHLPAARQGDSIIEAGPPNSIAVGFPKVQIG